MRIQHLVLDDDVHKALKARKKKVGITVKEIGNSALRAALSIPTKEELVVEKLVTTGKITRKEYVEAVRSAERELRSGYKRLSEVVASRPEGAVVEGGKLKAPGSGARRRQRDPGH